MLKFILFIPESVGKNSLNTFIFFHSRSLEQLKHRNTLNKGLLAFTMILYIREHIGLCRYKLSSFINFEFAQCLNDEGFHPNSNERYYISEGLTEKKRL